MLVLVDGDNISFLPKDKSLLLLKWIVQLSKFCSVEIYGTKQCRKEIKSLPQFRQVDMITKKGKLKSTTDPHITCRAAMQYMWYNKVVIVSGDKDFLVNCDLIPNCFQLYFQVNQDKPCTDFDKHPKCRKFKRFVNKEDLLTYLN